MTYTFPKEERLNSKKLIQELFEKGSSFYLYPFKLVYLPSALSVPAHQVLVSVSKRKFKKAVDRNLVKRKIKEAYRLNKHELLPDSSPILPQAIGIIYTGKEIHDYTFIESRMRKALQKLSSLLP